MSCASRCRFALPLVLASLAGCGEDGAAAPPAAADGGSGRTPASAIATTSSAGEARGGGGAWRSELYPEDWSPAYVSPSGHRIHDFSYAGYKNGRAPVGVAAVATEYDVTGYGADPTGATDATIAVQATLDAAATAGGGVVRFPAGDAGV